MKEITWDIEYLSPPPAVRHCRKCGEKTKYRSSGQFRVNAQKKSLDIWLIYRCESCNTTWNMELYSRVRPDCVPAERLGGFFSNEQELAWEYAMKMEWIRKRGGQPLPPSYEIGGEEFAGNVPVWLHINSKYSMELRLTDILKHKLKFSSSELTRRLNAGEIICEDGPDIKKRKLTSSQTLILYPPRQ